MWKHKNILPYVDYDMGKGQMGYRFFNQMENGKEEILLINYQEIHVRGMSMGKAVSSLWTGA